MSAPVSVVAGLAALLLGGLLMVTPQQAAELIVVLLSLFLIVKGVATVVEGSRQTDGMWGWRSLAGIVGVIVGLIVLATRAVSTLVAVVVAYYVLAVGLVVAGVLEAANGLRHHSWWAVLLGALQIVLALLIMFVPATGALVMLQFAGAFVIAIGVVLIASAFGRS